MVVVQKKEATTPPFIVIIILMSSLCIMFYILYNNFHFINKVSVTRSHICMPVSRTFSVCVYVIVYLYVCVADSEYELDLTDIHIENSHLMCEIP